MRIRTLLALASLAAASVLPAAAQTLKPGLWEIHNKMNNPELDQAMQEMQKQMAAMPPDQRKQMEAMMAKQGVKMVPSGQGMAVQLCMTREMVERDEIPMDKSDCRITSKSRSGKTMHLAYSCSNPPSTGESQVTMASPEAYSSRMTVKTVVDGRPQTMSMEGSGKWLKGDCGNVKPLVPPKK